MTKAAPHPKPVPPAESARQAAELFRLGCDHYERKDHAEAAALYRRALALAPGYALAWNGLGIALRALGDFAGAAEAYRRAIALQPDFATAYSNLGNALKDALDEQGSLAAHAKAVGIEPDNAGYLYNQGIAYACFGHNAQALACYDRALELKPDDPLILWDRARVLLHLGDYTRGWPAYESRWGLADHRPRRLDAPEWDGRPFGGRLLLFAEQGFGDSLQCLRFLPYVKALGGTVVLECQKELIPLIKGLPGIDEIAVKGDPLPPHDLRFPLLSLPRFFAPSPDAIAGSVPYVHPPEDRAQPFRDLFAKAGGKFKVGIVWSGSVTFKGNRTRATSLANFLRYLPMEGVQLYSLQKGPPEAELRALDGEAPIIDLAPMLKDFGDTAAAVAALDLVIMTDSSVAHLCGAMGCPVWVLLGTSSHWLWLEKRDDSPWYPSMRFFRQSRHGDWDELFGRVRAALAERAGAKAAPVPAGPAASGMNVVKRCRDGVMLFNRNDRFIGRSLALYGEYGGGEHKLFRQLLRPGDVMVDAGANIGVHTLFCARIVGPRGLVHAFEPQRVVNQMLSANMALNDITWVHCHHRALGRAPGTAFVPPIDYGTLNNFGGIALNSDNRGEPVAVTTLDSLELASCRLIKIDVEGMEAEVLEGARELVARCRPILYVENDRREHSAALITLIQSLGYRLWWHMPPLFSPDNAAGNKRNVFGDILSINMLCLPDDSPIKVAGLRPVTGPEDWWKKTT